MADLCTERMQRKVNLLYVLFLVSCITTHESDVMDEDFRKATWSPPAQQRIRAFLWISYHDRVLVNLNRYKCMMTGDPSYFICGGMEQSTLHLHDNPAARLVWRKVSGPSRLLQFFQTTLKDWIDENVSKVSNL